MDAISYRDAETAGNSDATGTISLSNSDTFGTLLPEALYNCLKYQTDVYCQTLANLCVLKMYDLSQASCKALYNLQTSTANSNDFYAEWPSGLPWIFYTSEPDTVRKQSGRIQATMSLDGYELEFVLARYSLEGEFMGFEDLTTQLQLCSSALDDGETYRRFGVTFINECKFDLNQLIGNNPPQETNYFYEAYFVDIDGSLIDIPILIENYIDESGDNPNMDDVTENWKFSRRFFIYDTISGIEGAGNYELGGSPTAFRWLHNAKLVVQLDDSNKEQIYVPYF